MSRLSSMCPLLSYLILSEMDNLTEAGRLTIFGMFRHIIQRSPPIKVLNLYSFSFDKDRDENLGELFLETLLSSSIDSITDLILGGNSSWFQHPDTKEERSVNVDLLAELISKQISLQQIDLSYNKFSSSAT